MNRLKIDRGEVSNLGIEGRQTTFVLEPSAVVMESDIGPLPEESTSEFQGEREPPEQPADSLGLVVFGMGRVVADGMAGVVAEEQPEGRLLGQDGDLDRMESPQFASPSGEEDVAGQSGRAAFGSDRPVELGGVFEVVEDQQGLGPSLELLEGGLELLVGGLVAALGPQLRADPSEPLVEPFGGVEPEDAARVVGLIAVDVFNGELGLADAPHAGQPGGANPDRLPLLEDGVQLIEVVGAADEVGIPGERHEERN
jgi:hypothetical protein